MLGSKENKREMSVNTKMMLDCIKRKVAYNIHQHNHPDIIMLKTTEIKSLII